MKKFLPLLLSFLTIISSPIFATDYKADSLVAPMGIVKGGYSVVHAYFYVPLYPNGKYISIYYSSDSIFSDNDLLIYNNDGNLGYQAADLYFSVPESAKIGEYILLVVDGNKSLVDDVPSNNVASLQIKKFIAPVHKVVLKDSYPVKVQNTKDYEKLQFINHGNVVETGAFSVEILLSVDTIADAEDRQIANKTINLVILPGNISLYVSYNADWSVPVGNYYLLYKVHVNPGSNLDPYEIEFKRSLEVVSKDVDLVMVSIGSNPAVFSKGTTAYLYAGVENEGPTPGLEKDSIQVKFYFSTDTLFDGADQYKGKYRFRIDEGGSLKMTFPKTIPDSIYLFAVAEFIPIDGNGEKNTSNNSRYKLITFTDSLPDITVGINFSDIRDRYVDVEGVSDKHRNMVHVNNDGTKPVKGVHLTYYFSKDSIRTKDDLFIFDTLLAGNVYQNEAPFLYPSFDAYSLPEGRNYIIAIVDEQNLIRESRENNNSCVFEFDKFLPRYELILYNVSVDTLHPDHYPVIYRKFTDSVEVNLNFSVINDAKKDPSITQVGFYLSADRNFDPSKDQLLSLKEYNGPYINYPSMDYYFQLKDAELSSGYLICVLDPFGKYPEYSLSNNIAYFRIQLNGMVTEVAQEEDQAFVLYPNPFNENLFINLNYDAYRILDLTGNVVKSGEFSSSISTKELNPGLYVAELKCSDKIIRQKLVKQD